MILNIKFLIMYNKKQKSKARNVVGLKTITYYNKPC